MQDTLDPCIFWLTLSTADTSRGIGYDSKLVDITTSTWPDIRGTLTLKQFFKWIPRTVFNMPRCKRASLSRDEHCPRCLQQASGFSNSPFLVNLSAPLSSQHFPWGWTWHKCCKRKIGQWRRFLTSPTACHKWGHKCSSQNSPRMHWLTLPPSNLEAQMPSNVQPHQHCQAPNTERLDFEWQSLVTVFCCGVLRPLKCYNWHATGCSSCNAARLFAM